MLGALLVEPMWRARPGSGPASAGALAFACAGMFALAFTFNRLVLQHLIEPEPAHIPILMCHVGRRGTFPRGPGKFCLKRHSKQHSAGPISSPGSR